MSKPKKYDDALSAPEGLDKHWAWNGARLMEKRTYRSQDVFLGDGGPHYDARKLKGLSADEEWMKLGYYVSVFAIQRGKAFVGFPLYFEIGHDLNYTKDDRSKMRINSAFEHAKSIIDDGLDMVDPPIFREHSLILKPNGADFVLPWRRH